MTTPGSTAPARTDAACSSGTDDNRATRGSRSSEAISARSVPTTSVDGRTGGAPQHPVRCRGKASESLRVTSYTIVDDAFAAPSGVGAGEATSRYDRRAPASPHAARVGARGRGSTSSSVRCATHRPPTGPSASISSPTAAIRRSHCSVARSSSQMIAERSVHPRHPGDDAVDPATQAHRHHPRRIDAVRSPRGRRREVRCNRCAGLFRPAAALVRHGERGRAGAHHAADFVDEETLMLCEPTSTPRTRKIDPSDDVPAGSAQAIRLVGGLGHGHRGVAIQHQEQLLSAGGIGRTPLGDSTSGSAEEPEEE